MCGRYANTHSDDDLKDVFDIVEAIGEELPPSYNIAPTQPVRIALTRTDRDSGDRQRELHTARWGLVPSWAKDLSIGARMINARSETITEKPAFRKAAAQRRCIVPADGYYEWMRRDGRKVPYFLHGDGVLAMAGLYEWWRRPDAADDDPDRWVLSTTIITRAATDTIGEIHDRAPLVLTDGNLDDWLDPSITAPKAITELVDHVVEPALVPYEVGPAVGNVANNSPDLLEPVGT